MKRALVGLAGILAALAAAVVLMGQTPGTFPGQYIDWSGAGGAIPPSALAPGAAATNLGVTMTSPGVFHELATSGASPGAAAFTVIDHGRTGADNTQSINIDVSEGLTLSAGQTHYGEVHSFTETATGSHDRIGSLFLQTCQATLAGQSCVGSTVISEAGGGGFGGYTGLNSITYLPPGLAGGPSTVAVGIEADLHTWSPSELRNGLRVADESNQPGVSAHHASSEDAAIAVVVSDFFGIGGLGFHIGLQFGEQDQGQPGNWPILPNGTAIQGNNPAIRLLSFMDLSGSTSGFNACAICLPINSANNGISWGLANTAGNIESTSTTGAGGEMIFTDTGTVLKTVSGGATLANFGGVSGITNEFFAATTILDGTLKVVTLPTSAGTGGLYVCVDSTGAFYKKASCP